MQKGIVVSDLHLFSRRSQGLQALEHLYSLLAGVDILVFNGDIFDFRWSRLATNSDTVREAASWLTAVMRLNPHCRVEFVLGNHDCHEHFVEELSELEERWPAFSWHDHSFSIGENIFLHGDCANRRMSRRGLDRYRKKWSRRKKKGRTMAAGYEMLDRTGIIPAFHQVYFPPERAVRRIWHHLNDAAPEVLEGVRNVFFGHTHLPFANFPYRGINFHNTGSALKGCELNFLKFQAK